MSPAVKISLVGKPLAAQLPGVGGEYERVILSGIVSGRRRTATPCELVFECDRNMTLPFALTVSATAACSRGFPLLASTSSTVISVAANSVCAQQRQTNTTASAA